MIKSLLTLCLFGAMLPTLSAQSYFSDSTRLSLLTCSPGDALYSTFGHSGLRLYDPVNQLDIVFNWGIFDFDTPNFYLKFLRGKLLYQMGMQRFENFRAEYLYLGRQVTSMDLYLPLDAKRQLLRQLEENYRPENRGYRYDFFFDNCASRIRTVLERALPLEYPTRDTLRAIKTFRQRLDEYLVEMPWSNFGIDLILGLPTDRPASFRNEMFLPDYLEKNLQKARYQDRPLADPVQTLLYLQPRPAPKPMLPRPEILLSILAALWLLGSWRLPRSWARRLDALWLLVIALAGLLMLLLWLGTDHLATKNNLNVLWASPVYFWALLAPRQRLPWLLLAGLGAITLLGFPWWPQQFHPAIIPVLVAVVVRTSWRWRQLTAPMAA